MAVLLIDLRAHGESGGDLCSGGAFERRDVLGAYDFAIARGAAPGCIGVLGFSLGAAAGLMAAASERGMAAVVADSVFADLESLVAGEAASLTMLPEWSMKPLVPGMRLVARVWHGIDTASVALDRAASQREYPILVIHGSRDERVTADHAVRVHAAAPPGSELWIVDGALHGGAFGSDAAEYQARVGGLLQPPVDGRWALRQDEQGSAELARSS